MKKTLLLIMLCFSLIASAALTEETEIGGGTPNENILIAYFSRWGNSPFPDDVDVSSSASVVLDQNQILHGTTAYIATQIQNATGGTLHLIQTETPYPADYDETVEQNRREQEDGFIPALHSSVEHMERIDTIFIGFPVWATTLPQAVEAFLRQYDLSGKTIVPFCTHAGYGSGGSFDRIRAICPASTVLDGLAIEAESVLDSAPLVAGWLQDAGFSADAEGQQIAIAVGGQIVANVELNDSPAAHEFASMLPMTVRMTRMGEHEYYGSMKQPLTHTTDVQTGYTVGDLAFWTPGDLLAVYFDEPDRAPEGLMILGHVTSDIAAIAQMADDAEMSFVLQ